MVHALGIKTVIMVAGQSLSELFAIKNQVVYVSPTVHVSNKLTKAQ